MVNEKEFSVKSGFLMLGLSFLILAVGIVGIILMRNPLFVLLMVLFVVMLFGFFIIQPNESRVMIFLETIAEQ